MSLGLRWLMARAPLAFGAQSQHCNDSFNNTRRSEGTQQRCCRRRRYRRQRAAACTPRRSFTQAQQALPQRLLLWLYDFIISLARRYPCIVYAKNVLHYSRDMMPKYVTPNEYRLCRTIWRSDCSVHNFYYGQFLSCQNGYDLIIDSGFHARRDAHDIRTGKL